MSTKGLLKNRQGEIDMENEKMSIGKNIAELRKQKGVTQEILADAVGVSGQAVSKWEGGGSPDIELLQPIADYFDVTIDRLFGRSTHNFTDISGKVASYLRSTDDMDERFRKVFELCWLMEFATFGSMKLHPPPNEEWHIHSIPDINALHGRQFSQILIDGGITSLGMNNDLRYFLAMPQPEEGWGKVLYYKDAYKDMFALLADEETLKTLFFLYSRNENKPFTPKFIEKHLGIMEEKAVAILEGLEMFIYASEIEFDDEIKTVYNFDENPAFVPFLTFLEELLNKPNSFTCYQSGRTKSYL